MKEYCVDLELAKELKENGFPQKACFYHEIYTYDTDGTKETAFVNRDKFLSWKKSDNHNFYPAPSSDEILKELPQYILINNDYPNYLRIDMFPDFIRVGYPHLNNWFDDIKLSNALAKMWLYLKKEGYIK